MKKEINLFQEEETEGERKLQPSVRGPKPIMGFGGDIISPFIHVNFDKQRIEYDNEGNMIKLLLFGEKSPFRSLGLREKQGLPMKK